MNRVLALLFALVVWFAVVAQFVLMMQNRVAAVPETLIRFFSFFTILTNILVALFFTARLFNAGSTNKPGVLTAITIYIFIVGTVYQTLLRKLWHPTGMQAVVDELLHTIDPMLTLVFWFLFEKKREVRYGQIPAWLIYPLIHLVFILLRGAASGFYPYPFVEVTKIGLAKTLRNSLFLTLFFVVISFAFVALCKKLSSNKISTV